MSRVIIANASARSIDAATRGLSRAIYRVLTRIGQREARAAIARIESRGLRSAIRKSAWDQDAPELASLIGRYGVRQYKTAAARAAKSVGSQWVSRPTLVDKYTAELADKVVLIIDETRDMIQASLRALIQEALKEEPRPSYNEVARRIARQWHGPADQREALFGFARAERIARTEMAGAANSGTAQGYTDSGVERIAWLANTDGKSGDRHHERMNNKKISVAAMNGTSTEQWFETPLGNRIPYPCWPGGPAKEIINCRCDIVPA